MEPEPELSYLGPFWALTPFIPLTVALGMHDLGAIGHGRSIPGSLTRTMNLIDRLKSTIDSAIMLPCTGADHNQIENRTRRDTNPNGTVPVLLYRTRLSQVQVPPLFFFPIPLS